MRSVRVCGWEDRPIVVRGWFCSDRIPLIMGSHGDKETPPPGTDSSECESGRQCLHVNRVRVWYPRCDCKRGSSVGARTRIGCESEWHRPPHEVINLVEVGGWRS